MEEAVDLSSDRLLMNELAPTCFSRYPTIITVIDIKEAIDYTHTRHINITFNFLAEKNHDFRIT